MPEYAPRGVVSIGPSGSSTTERNPQARHGSEHAPGLRLSQQDLITRARLLVDSTGADSQDCLPSNAITIAVKTVQTPKMLLLVEAQDIGNVSADDLLPPLEGEITPSSFFSRYANARRELLSQGHSPELSRP